MRWTAQSAASPGSRPRRLRYEVGGDHTGSLEAGKRAHLVVLDRDILSVDPETIADTKVVTTYLDGQLVYAAPTGGAAEPRRTKKVITIDQFARITTQSSDRRFSSAQALRAEPSEKSAKRARYHCVSSF